MRGIRCDGGESGCQGEDGADLERKLGLYWQDAFRRIDVDAGQTVWMKLAE